MNDRNAPIEKARAALAPHGLFVRGVLHPDGSDRPALDDGAPAATVMLIGNIGGSLWPAFSAWRSAQDHPVEDPLDRRGTPVHPGHATTSSGTPSGRRT